MDLFEQATRRRYRFQTSVGYLSVEDLWQLPLTNSRGANLKSIATALAVQLKDNSTDELGFFNEAIEANPELQAKFDIVKHIVTVRVAENKAKTDEKEKAAKKKEIRALIADKKKESLASKSIEDLEALERSL